MSPIRFSPSSLKEGRWTFHSRILPMLLTHLGTIAPVPVEVLQPDPGALEEPEVAHCASGVAARDHRHHRHLRDPNT
jgi:hypothetical protein